jgi:hypothetical protein
MPAKHSAPALNLALPDVQLMVAALRAQRAIEDQLLTTRLTAQQRSLLSQLRNHRLHLWAALNPPDWLLEAPAQGA